MSSAAHVDTHVDDLSRHLDAFLLVVLKGRLLCHEPRLDVAVDVHLELGLQHAHSAERRQCVFLKSDQVFLGNDARDVLLMSSLALSLAGLLLVGSAFSLGLHSSLSSFEALSFNQLGVPHLFVLFLLVLHDGEFGLFEDLHARLLQRLQAEHVEHGLDLGIEIEQLSIVIEDLGLFAVLLCRHLWLEQRYGRSVKVELCGNADFLGRGFVSQILNVFVSLKADVGASLNGLWRGNVPVRVDGNDTLGCLQRASGLAH